MSKKVRYTKLAAEFILNNPEAWCISNSEPNNDFYNEVVAAMATLMGDTIVGTIGQSGATKNVYKVTFEVPKVGSFWAYYELGREVKYL